MLRLTERINEGFFGNGYDRYKRKVLDALSSIGIIIDEEKMKRAEDWIRDYYADKMDAYDCASAVKDEFRRYRAPLKESFERYATVIIDSAPSLLKKNAVKRIQTMDRIQKVQFDNVVITLCDLKNLDPKDLLASRGYDIMKLVQDGALNTDQIIERIGQQILRKKNERMSVEEALEIIKESGRRVDKTNTDASDWMDMVKMELIKLGYGPVTANSYVTDEWRADIIQNFKDGYTPKEAAEQLNRFLEEQERDES
jgi:hypothetical protein